VPVRDRSTVYGLAAIDDRGRIAESTVIRALGWLPGTRLDVRENGGLLLVSADRQGVARALSALSGEPHPLT
jgi:hypothetical protein